MTADVAPVTPAETAAERQARSRAAYIDGLRQLADALQEHPELPLPYEGSTGTLSFYFLGYDDDVRERLAAAARALPCVLAKSFRDYDDGDSTIKLNGELAGLKVELTAYRDVVCTRRVVGTREQEVDEVVTPAVTRKVTRQVDDVEWDCGSLLRPRPEATA